ncbi:Phox/Bem1p (PB1) domain-containing protein [Klebsormidium nitens]|uniref:Phox/Bem1p (PB1) domain-containing protein n=1 Tax=Klebsormidium nitens TaxID=105231 RepID=A0A1Y1I1Q2_KLENI|nr:Phox/Bem1p (PB1) domain-containing protein [Klebsormidium nitens]|eukprot:GAQ84845.1 Phox/Bem1p (PB1) domain-containing protein [Klebsormidium nitens]
MASFLLPPPSAPLSPHQERGESRTGQFQEFATEPAPDFYPEIYNHWDAMWRGELGNRAKHKLSDLKSPSERLHRLETLAFWRLLRRAARTLEHPRPVTERSDEAIVQDNKEHVRNRERGWLNERNSEKGKVLRSYLEWPEGIPLHDPDSFKKLGYDGKELRECFVSAVHWQEEQAWNDKASFAGSPMSSIWSLPSTAESGPSSSRNGYPCLDIHPLSSSWREIPPIGSIRSLSSFGSSMDIPKPARSHSSRGSNRSVDGARMFKVKFLCSAGGDIRFTDGAWRYVGGETRFFTVSRDITYSELSFNLTKYCGTEIGLKYQLPDSNLDTLVFLSNDRDLNRMMEEYDENEWTWAGKAQRLRLFVFPELSLRGSFGSRTLW